MKYEKSLFDKSNDFFMLADRTRHPYSDSDVYKPPLIVTRRMEGYSGYSPTSDEVFSAIRKFSLTVTPNVKASEYLESCLNDIGVSLESASFYLGVDSSTGDCYLESIDKNDLDPSLKWYRLLKVKENE
jgi:hypothetical protein